MKTVGKDSRRYVRAVRADALLSRVSALPALRASAKLARNSQSLPFFLASATQSTTLPNRLALPCPEKVQSVDLVLVSERPVRLVKQGRQDGQDRPPRDFTLACGTGCQPQPLGPALCHSTPVARGPSACKKSEATRPQYRLIGMTLVNEVFPRLSPGVAVKDERQSSE